MEHRFAFLEQLYCSGVYAWSRNPQNLGWGLALSAEFGEASPLHLLTRDLWEVQPDFLAGVLPEEKIPKVLITLALTVFEDCETVFANLYNAMPPGTRFALMEVCAEKGARGAWLLDFIGQADVSRRVWEPLKARLSAPCAEVADRTPHN